MRIKLEAILLVCFVYQSKCGDFPDNEESIPSEIVSVADTEDIASGKEESPNVSKLPRDEKSLVGYIYDGPQPGHHHGHEHHHGQEHNVQRGQLHGLPFFINELAANKQVRAPNHHHAHQHNRDYDYDERNYDYDYNQRNKHNPNSNSLVRDLTGNSLEETSEERDEEDIAVAEERENIIDTLQNLKEGEDGRKCIDKIMMVKETVYDEVLTCDHSYDQRCHTSYVTKYEPHQEEDCEDHFRKECLIDYEKKSIEELVEYCVTPMVKDCDIEGEEECQIVYQSECYTRQKVHEVEDQVPNCETIYEQKCEDIVVGLTTEAKCDTWPREVCNITTEAVKKYTPETTCEKLPTTLCAPKGCGIKQGPVECRDKMKTVVIDNPIEECDLEPFRVCKHATKLVPKLVASKECVDVPKEVCARSKINPRVVNKPAIQKWCFKPQDYPVPGFF